MKNIVLILISILFSVTLLCYLTLPTPENFSVQSISELRGDISKAQPSPESFDKIYVRLYDLVGNEMLVFKFDVEKIKKITGMTSKSKVLEAGCGVGRHLKLFRKLIPGMMMEGVDKS